MSGKVFVLVPSFHPTGPIKGALALANELAAQQEVCMVSLKPGPGVDARVHERVTMVCLADRGRWHRRIRAYRRMLREAGGRPAVASVSFCFSADLANLACRRDAVICSSVRGNLAQNYRLDHGYKGLLVATAHLALLRGFDHVVAMSASMAEQVRRMAGRRPAVIGNFVDESVLERYRVSRAGRTGAYRFVFVGSLSRRKQPLLLLEAVAGLRGQGVEVHLDIIGDGPLRAEVEQATAGADLGKVVRLHGYLAEPYSLVAEADCMVLPSLSEGMSRAILEALYLGVPCVLRDVDGHDEIVQPGYNGLLFARDDALAAAMVEAAAWSRTAITGQSSLLPVQCRQREAAQRYLELVGHADGNGTR